MIASDTFFEVKNAILVNKVRSGLTALGIVIGIASVIAMIAIGRGAQTSIEESIQAIGANLLMIRPGASFGPGTQISGGQGSAQTLTANDALAIEEKVTTVEAVAPEASRRYQVSAKGANSNVSVTGVTPSYAAVRNVVVESGAFLSVQQEKSRAKVAVIGPDTRTDLFGEGIDPVGQKIRINGIEFTVIGMTKTRGGTGFGSSDDVIYVPLQTFQQFLSGDDILSLINVTVENQEMMEVADAEITELLLSRHRVSDADFRIMNQADIVSTASSVTGTFTVLLGAVAGISLVVGGIGIMNMMLTTVTERTREIGLRKAIGARRRDISVQFLLEAIALTFLGGCLGIALGAGVAYGVERYAGITTEISSSSIVLAFGVAAAIGVVFGWYPARRAARLSPIEALRYE